MYLDCPICRCISSETRRYRGAKGPWNTFESPNADGSRGAPSIRSRRQSYLGFNDLQPFLENITHISQMADGCAVVAPWFQANKLLLVYRFVTSQYQWLHRYPSFDVFVASTGITIFIYPPIPGASLIQFSSLCLHPGIFLT